MVKISQAPVNPDSSNCSLFRDTPHGAMRRRGGFARPRAAESSPRRAGLQDAILQQARYDPGMAIAVERLHRITTDVYERMAAGGLLPERGVELVDGLVVEMSPKGARHGYAVTRLNEQLVDQRQGRYVVSADSLSLRLGPRDEPEPDVALARTTRSYARERPRHEEIALIVEVADSSLAFDLGEKRAKYAGAGIPEYWVVDLKDDVVHVFRNPRGEVYLDRHAAKPGDIISPAEYPDVVVDVALVLGDS